MTNGSNNWDVNFSRITFLQDVLSQHDNIKNLRRDRDILFTFDRIKQKDTLHLLCLDKYVFGENDFYAVIKEFPDVNIICVGGVWNKYTRDAKDICKSKEIGLYNVGELKGGLYGKNIGCITRKMMMEIQSIPMEDKRNLYAVYLFGSFFRQERNFLDIDLLFVSAQSLSNSLIAYNNSRVFCKNLQAQLDIKVDFNFLTYKEFQENLFHDLVNGEFKILYKQESTTF